MKPLNINRIKRFEYVVVNDNEYMFTSMRIDRESLPAGLFAYDVRDSDECSGVFAQIKPYVMVNHWGTIIGADKIPLDENDSYYPDEDECGFTDECGTLQEYMIKHQVPCIDWFAAECMEFHNSGQYEVGLTLPEAARLYLEFLAKGNLLGCSLGFTIHDPSLGIYDDISMDLVTGAVIHGDELAQTRTIAEHPLARKAVLEARKMFPKFKYIPLKPAPSMDDINRQVRKNETETEYGEYQTWIYLQSGRSIEICYESNDLSEEERFYSIRLHCSEQEYEDDRYHSSMGVIHQECLAHGQDLEKVKQRVAVLIDRFNEDL